jgi:hypothetical protein
MMRRLFLVAVAAGGAAWMSAAPARGESCSPAMCASMSPACWNALTKAVTAKDEKIRNVDRCRELAADLDGQGSFLKVPDLTPEAALCACEAVFWSQGGLSQGLPDVDDTTQEDSNSADDDE